MEGNTYIDIMSTNKRKEKNGVELERNQISIYTVLFFCSQKEIGTILKLTCSWLEMKIQRESTEVYLQC